LFHFYKRPDTAERPFYHTEPEGIHRYPHADVRSVVISGLAIEREGEYEPNEKVLLKLPLEPVYRVQLFSTAETVLIIPLGTTPMVATQLYALLKNEGRTIREVALIYPALSQKVRNSATLIKDAFASESPSLPVRDVSIAGIKDIISEEHCVQYQQTLEASIDAMRERHPDCEIVLSLSGGRKSMAALAMFAAQRKGIRYVYHTLIKDPVFSRDVEDKTTVTALRSPKISKQERNDRLFLRAYPSKQDQFVLFKVPIVPTGSHD
jgi:CRISPR-associated Csx14 family protein